MEKTLSSQATNCLEGRRLRAWELHRKGWKQRDIAEALGVTQGAVSQWLKRGREGGVEGLRHQPPPGATPQLSSTQREQLLELLAQGAQALGFPGDVWTQPRVATLIRDRFITPEGKLYLMVQERAYCGRDVVGFLKHLARHVAGKLLVLWDGAPIHRSRVVKEYLSHGAAQRIHLEQFPGYAPELNPAEGIWNHLKRVELKNLCCQSISHLSYELRKATDHLRHKTKVILGCIKQPGVY